MGRAIDMENRIDHFQGEFNKIWVRLNELDKILKEILEAAEPAAKKTTKKKEVKSEKKADKKGNRSSDEQADSGHRDAESKDE